MLATILAFAISTQWPPSTLQPKIYASPSGEWSLSVDPSSPSGAGPARVAVARSREQAWKAELPFTYWDALITDTGHAAGYGFTNGGPDRTAKGEFVVAIFAPDGTVRLEAREPMTNSNFFHTNSNPDPTGLFVQPLLDRFVVRVSDPDINAADESWWSYSLSTGEKLGRVQPKHTLENPTPLRFSMDARAVPETPLTLVQWYSFDWRTRADHDLGTHFVLVDSDWKPVWTLALPKDFRQTDPKIEMDGLDELRSTSGILAASAPRRFELRHVVDSARVTYEVSADPGTKVGWAVSEVARAPYVEAKPEPKELPVLELRKLASVALRVNTPKFGAPIRDIETFDFDAEGRVRFVRREPDGGSTLVSLDDQGSVVREVRVDALAAGVEGARAWSALKLDRWLFSLSPYGDGARSRAWIVDGASGEAQELENFSGPFVEEVAAASDGGFVLLGTYSATFTSSDVLIRFDADGQRRWELHGDGDHESESSLFSPEDVAFDSDGSVLVLGNIRNWIQVFDENGQFVRKLDLEELWGAEQRYLTDIVVEPSGHWLISDFHGGVSWMRADRNGKVLETFAPKRENGSTEIGSSSTLRVDSTGRRWGTDRAELYVIDSQGVAHTRFGAPPDPRALQKAVSVLLDDSGHVALVDERTSAMHMFDANGAPGIVFAPDPTDLNDGAKRVDSIVRGHDGSLYLQPSRGARDLAFTADGKRIGWTERGGEHVAFLANGERWLVTESPDHASSVHKLAPGGTERTKIARRPNGWFYTGIHDISCARDGSLAVLCSGELGLEVDLFSADGAPQRTFDLRDAPRNSWRRLNHTERWILVSSYSQEALLVSLPDGRISLVRSADGDKKWTHAYGFSPDGKELLCATLRPPALHRFALPE